MAGKTSSRRHRTLEKMLDLALELMSFKHFEFRTYFI